MRSNLTSSRFAPQSHRKASQYITAAWNLVPPLLRLPSTDVAAGLLLLSWAEFGEVRLVHSFASAFFLNCISEFREWVVGKAMSTVSVSMFSRISEFLWARHSDGA